MAPSCKTEEATLSGINGVSRSRCSVHATAKAAARAAARRDPQREALPEEAPGQAQARFGNVTGVLCASDLDCDTTAGRVSFVTKRRLHLPGIGTERNPLRLMAPPPVLDPSGLNAERAGA